MPPPRARNYGAQFVVCQLAQLHTRTLCISMSTWLVAFAVPPVGDPLNDVPFKIQSVAPFDQDIGDACHDPLILLAPVTPLMFICTGQKFCSSTLVAKWTQNLPPSQLYVLAIGLLTQFADNDGK